jgi:hypothetical protein
MFQRLAIIRAVVVEKLNVATTLEEILFIAFSKSRFRFH